MVSMVIIFSLNKSKACQVASLLADKLDKIYLNVDDLIEYDLKFFKEANENYYNQLLDKTFSYVFSLEECVACISVNDAIKQNVRDKLGKTSSFYIDVKYDERLSLDDKIVFDELQYDCKKIAKYIVLDAQIDELVNNIYGILKDDK